MEEEGVSTTPTTGAGGECGVAQGNPTREDDRSSNPRPAKRQRGQGEEGDGEEDREAEGEGEEEGKKTGEDMRRHTNTLSTLSIIHDARLRTRRLGCQQPRPLSDPRCQLGGVNVCEE
jgi:hypothetical protein